ncbi:acyltransferase [Bradyrhizobium jicamae]|uniref:acyltransferase family protein n=1 Tax=Bradyrhizobium jicamae TaxID=280332 RepID=UPI001BABF56B|nr:acyltransferase [Bradyrhizobium jicamae]MBR0751631.1 acyltransferase [Bradyrhizobium jicamae]
MQAARAIAALSVAYFHSYAAIRGAFPESAWMPVPWLKQWGFLGVDFFFAISGYVICLVVTKPSFTLGGFAIKRLLRLYPMYWTALVLMGLLIWWGRSGPVSWPHVLYSMTLLPQQGTPAYDVSWTLEREVVFYALAALIVPIGRVWGLAVVLAGLAAAGFYYRNPWSFHLVSTVQADFLAGVLVFMARYELSRIGGLIPLLIGIAILAVMRQAITPYAVPIAMAALLAGMVHVRIPWERAPFSWLVRTGDASYSIYLLHYLVFVVMSYASVVYVPFHLPEWAAEPWRFLSIAVCVAVSWLTFTVIESPMIRLGHYLARSPARRDAPRAAVPNEIYSGQNAPIKRAS